MANRHSHKKLRAEARARMLRTGESYQQARQKVLEQASASALSEVVSGLDLVEFRYFGKPAVLASWHSFGVPVAIVISESLRRPWMLPRFMIPSADAPRLGGDK